MSDRIVDENRERSLDISKVQSQIIVFFYDFMGGIGRPPSIREIMTAVDLNSTSAIAFQLDRLHELGWLEVAGEPYDTRRYILRGAEWNPLPLPDEIRQRAAVIRKSDQALHDLAQIADRLGYELE